MASEEIVADDVFTRLALSDCSVYMFDVAEMIKPESLWILPDGWLPLSEVEIVLPEMIEMLAMKNTIFVSNSVINSFSPIAVASGFQIEGDFDANKLFADVGDRLPADAVKQNTETCILVQDLEYVCARIVSQFTALSNGMATDFKSMTVFDMYLIDNAIHVLMQRTVITPHNSDVALPVFNNASPQGQKGQ